MSSVETRGSSDPIKRTVDSIGSILSWFEDALTRLQQELKAYPEVNQRFLSLEYSPMDLSTRLQQLQEDIHAFKRELRRNRREIWWSRKRDGHTLKSTDLPEEERQQLGHINAQLEFITEQIGVSATEIARGLDARLADAADVLWDYEIDAEARFVLREDDPGYSDESDNLLATLQLDLNEKQDSSEGLEVIGVDYPNGRGWDPLPHGRLFHMLHDQGPLSGDHPPLSLKDVLRIGDVWVDLIVRYQFYYDINHGRWIKNFSSENGDRRASTYVQEKPNS